MQDVQIQLLILCTNLILYMKFHEFWLRKRPSTGGVYIVPGQKKQKRFPLHTRSLLLFAMKAAKKSLAAKVGSGCTQKLPPTCIILQSWERGAQQEARFHSQTLTCALAISPQRQERPSCASQSFQGREAPQPDPASATRRENCCLVIIF